MTLFQSHIPEDNMVDLSDPSHETELVGPGSNEQPYQAVDGRCVTFSHQTQHFVAVLKVPDIKEIHQMI